MRNAPVFSMDEWKISWHKGAWRAAVLFPIYPSAPPRFGERFDWDIDIENTRHKPYGRMALWRYAVMPHLCPTYARVLIRLRLLFRNHG